MPIEPSAVSWTSAELLADVRQKARIPAGTVDYPDAVLLEEATRAIWSFAGWATSQSSDGRQLAVFQRASAAALLSTYAPGREIELPFDSVGDGFDSVVWVGPSDVETRLELVDLAVQPLYDSPNAAGTTPWGYSVVDGRLRLYPRPLVAGTVRIAYQRRLPRLILASDSRAVTLVTYNAAFVDVAHGGTQLCAIGDWFDVITSSAPYRYAMPNALVTGGTPTSLRTGTYTSATNNAVTAGMTVVRSGSSPYVHLPLEFKQALTQKIAAQILSEIGDAQGAAALEQRAEAEVGRVLAILNPRSKTSRVKVVNPYSLMRARRIGRWGG